MKRRRSLPAHLVVKGPPGKVREPFRAQRLPEFGKILEVARALATKPELLLLDEMMAGLNQTEVAQAMHLITSIRDRGITIIMIEHVMKAIMNVCNRIIVLHHGSKIAEGTPQEITRSEKVIEVYLGEETDA